MRRGTFLLFSSTRVDKQDHPRSSVGRLSSRLGGNARQADRQTADRQAAGEGGQQAGGRVAGGIQSACCKFRLTEASKAMSRRNLKGSKAPCKAIRQCESKRNHGDKMP
jgi:hypothetical protein